ncbi:MAG TPA: sigma-70 family RNA polymerase sigma factor, partial [Myxococcales bacterium]
ARPTCPLATPPPPDLAALRHRNAQVASTVNPGSHRRWFANKPGKQQVLSGQVRFDGRSSVKTWLFGVIRLTALEQQRWGWMKRLLGQKPEPQAAPDDATAHRQEATRLSIAFVALSERQREVLHLVFYEGLTVRDAADVMGVSLGSARQHYERGKKNLAERLRQMGVER